MFLQRRHPVVFAAILLIAVLALTGCGKTQSADKGSGEKEQKSATADYPEQPITYIIPFNPGGQSDIEARRQQPYLEKDLGVKVNITYKPGGGGATGWAELVLAKPDGYTLCGFNIPHIILQPMERGNTGYKTEDIVPVAVFQATPIGLAVPKDSQFKTLDDFIKYAKDNPNKVTITGSGTYTGHHITYLQLQKLAGIKMTYVPTTGAAPAVQNLLGGHVQAMLGNSNDLVQHQDKIRVLAMASEKRFAALPNVPTFKELGYNIIESIDRGVAVPPKTPPEIIKRLEKAFLAIANNEEVKNQQIKQGFVPVSMGHDEAVKYIKTKTDEYSKLVDDLKATAGK
ncbi:MAG: hypothetical protein PWR22_710 [Moorella sp. (in: firmicutes)]|jgi:tripartite-type tricarboxylate transporter receptor subunit TctC|uniref:tripartite tricarboxylate transporter substrate binding protein n=1 Tax=Moorella sp. E306M TaxID=2572683 RepID=UPI0010FFB297|nr:tripartite tricarboxylate transporter substrate binding protein [Moorella sp. E306M]MDK2816081.1 hypothetical protein [Moorella sp. (in: firmicutes)]GEA17095.1 C4-dicarboxylate ABC transporter substrate-binding protein [Moorella sp. E306M]